MRIYLVLLMRLAAYSWALLLRLAAWSLSWSDDTQCHQKFFRSIDGSIDGAGNYDVAVLGDSDLHMVLHRPLFLGFKQIQTILGTVFLDSPTSRRAH